MLSHGNLLAQREAVLEVVRVTDADAVLRVLPLFHALALMANLVLPLSTGARVVFLETVNAAELLRALAEREITAFCCVPQFLYMLHQRVLARVAARESVARWAFRGLLAAGAAVRRAGADPGPVLFPGVHAALGGHMRLLVTGGSAMDEQIGADLFAMGFTVLQRTG